MNINNNIRAIIINVASEVYKRNRMTETMQRLNIEEYEIFNAITGSDFQFGEDRESILFNNIIYKYGIYAGEYPFRKKPLTQKEVGCSLSHHISINNYKHDYYTLILEDDAVFMANIDTWKDYIANLPAPDDYDIIFLSDCTWSATPYSKEKDYNSYYSYLSQTFNISGTHAYIINPKIIGLLNDNFDLTLAADDYLNNCINKYRLRLLGAREILFTQTPEKYFPPPTKNYKILFYNRIWGMDEKLSGIPRKDGFELYTDHKYIDESDVIVFHMPNLPIGSDILQKEKKRPGQIWVFWSMECEIHYEWQFEQKIMDLFDIKMTYKLNSDIPVPYIYPVYYEWLRNPPVVKTGLVNAFISSNFDRSNRLGYLKELMSYIEVHSYGKNLNNRPLGNDEGLTTKRMIMQHYKFSISFENAVARDYVTEKFFHPLILGSVPIYLGAPNVDDFAPANHCYLNVAAFSSVKALADYILDLDSDNARYDKLLAWKQLPYRESFNRIADIIYHNPFIRLYNLVQKRLEA